MAAARLEASPRDRQAFRALHRPRDKDHIEAARARFDVSVQTQIINKLKSILSCLP